MSEIDDLLDGDNDPEEAPETEAAEADEPDTDEGSEAEADEDDGDGEAEETQAEEPEPEKPKKPREQRSVPLAAFLETQRKLQEKLDAAEKRANELEAKASKAPDFSTFFKKPPEEIPSVYDDEQGFNSAGREAIQAESYNTRFGISANFAVKTHGLDVVNAALAEFDQAAQQNPLLRQALDNSYDPVGEIVTWTQTQKTLRKIQEAGGLEAYEKNLRATIESELKAKKPAQAVADDSDDEMPAKQNLNLPGNFNKGAKGGNKNAVLHSSLDELLG